MSLRVKVSAVVIGAAAIAGMLVTAPGASAQGCARQPSGTLICTEYPSSGGTLRLYVYNNSTVQGEDTSGRDVHLDKAIPGGWEGPLGGGKGWTSILNRQGTSWRACVNVGGGRYHCTPFA
ncbi:hypothetical protein M8C13_34970 [Crossiella sp. SN42]|uniref:hypothetical protein n=1 Tax=Crossiella sp. SN42 TaxID=2944808 RepID=UPI00207C7397|nr:hypothetical protein [Crossiella sp. SN42]MCO1580972.1 hypothetical protein [Crossiella sp. SN42]